MNNRGQVFFYTLMLGVIIIVLALALSSPVKQFVDSARGPSSDTAVGLDCGNTSISDFNKSQCLLTDLATPYFFWGLIGLAGVVIGAKIYFGGGQ